MSNEKNGGFVGKANRRIPIKSISIMECHKGFERCSIGEIVGQRKHGVFLCKTPGFL